MTLKITKFRPSDEGNLLRGVGFQVGIADICSPNLESIQLVCCHSLSAASMLGVLLGLAAAATMNKNKNCCMRNSVLAGWWSLVA